MKKDVISEGLAETDLAGSCQITVNNAETCEPRDTNLTQGCSGFDPTPESIGAMAALDTKASAQGATRFFDDPIHVRRVLIAKRQAAGAETPYGHACSNIVEILDGLFEYERPAWAKDVRQTLPWLMKQQIERLERLTAPRV